MEDKIRELKKYLEGSWSPMNLLVEKFSMSREELGQAFAEMLSMVDVRIDNDIVHVG